MKLFFKKIILFSFFLTINQSFAQVSEQLNQEVSPKQDVTDLALHFYEIDFNSEQRALLENQQIELIFKIEKDGKPILHKINGINDSQIQEILHNKVSELEYFNPKIVDGNAVSAIYFLNLIYPSNHITATTTNLFLEQQAFYKLNMSDFESIEISNEGSDLLLGFVANQFIGNPSRFNGIGPGIKMDYTFSDKKNFLYGFNMSLYANDNKRDYSIRTNTAQLNSRSVIMLGLSFGKWFDKFNIQADLNYVAQNITEKQYEKDPNWVQFRGFSPGVAMNYTFLLGKEKPTLYYGSPAIIGHHLNLHGGIRHLSLGNKEASGLMFELGISYRMRLKAINSYTLK